MPQTKEDALRAKILSGANNLFKLNGLNKTTMEDIAKEAGKGKSTLYYYFTSKEEIFDVILKSEKETFFNEVQESIAKVKTAREKLEVFGRARFEQIRKQTNLYNVIVQEARETLATNGQDPTAGYRRGYDQKLANIIKSILQFGIISGEFRILSEKEIEMLAFVIISASYGIENNLILYNKLDDMKEQMVFFQDLLFTGLRKT